MKAKFFILFRHNFGGFLLISTTLPEKSMSRLILLMVKLGFHVSIYRKQKKRQTPLFQVFDA